MFYFKSITIPNASPELIERAVRSYTVIRNSYLDFSITTGEYHDNKFFAGIEKENAFLLTRLKESDRFVVNKTFNSWRTSARTKIFVRFNKESGFASYQVRVGFFTLLFFSFLFIWILLVVRSLLGGGNDLNLLFLIFIFLGMKAVFIFKEIQITHKLIIKAIQRTRDDEMMARN